MVAGNGAADEQESVHRRHHRRQRHRGTHSIEPFSISAANKTLSLFIDVFCPIELTATKHNVPRYGWCRKNFV